MVLDIVWHVKIVLLMKRWNLDHHARVDQDNYYYKSVELSYKHLNSILI